MARTFEKGLLDTKRVLCKASLDVLTGHEAQPNDDSALVSLSVSSLDLNVTASKLHCTGFDYSGVAHRARPCLSHQETYTKARRRTGWREVPRLACYDCLSRSLAEGSGRESGDAASRTSSAQTEQCTRVTRPSSAGQNATATISGCGNSLDACVSECIHGRWT